MSQIDDANEKTSSEKTRNERRRFLTAGAAAAGALVLGTKSNAATANAATATSDASAALAPAELSLTLKNNAALAKIGGSVVVENGNDKIVVVRTDANSFVACSALCTHKGCVVDYEHETKQFVCPCHEARFSLDGKVVRGPAKKPLRSYATDAAAIVSLALPVAKKPVA